MSTYYIKGSSASVRLTDKDFIAKGGEKSVFARGGTAYCVYHDPKQAIPAGKIKELSSVQHPGVVLPTAELLDVKKRHCGEVMPFVEDSYAPKNPDIKPLVLCQLFTNAFRRKQGVDEKHVIRITDQILEIARHCWAAGIVLVDPNETNWLVRHDLKATYLIDTSCVQTQSYPGTAIKPAIRDHNASRFTVESDCFSLAVVLSWLWVGIHPYLAFHPKWEHMSADAAMIPRMKEHFSFFRDGTELNRACREIGRIPSNLGAWMRDVLDNGGRDQPPDKCGDGGMVTVVVPVVKPVSDGIRLTVLQTFSDDVVSMYGDFVTTESRWPTAVVVRTPRLDDPIAAYCDGRSLRLSHAETCEDIPITSNAGRVFESGGRAYAVGHAQVSEVSFNEVNGRVRATLRRVGSVADLPTTRVYRGCVVQNLLGTYLLSTFPESGQCVQYRLADIEGWQILDCGHENGVFVCAVEQGGQYKLLLYRLFEGKSDETLVSNQHGDVNFAVTDRGVCALMEPGGVLRICSSQMGSLHERRMTFPEPDMQLHSRDSKIVGSLGKSIYSIDVT